MATPEQELKDLLDSLTNVGTVLVDEAVAEIVDLVELYKLPAIPENVSGLGHARTELQALLNHAEKLTKALDLSNPLSIGLMRGAWEGSRARLGQELTEFSRVVSSALAELEAMPKGERDKRREAFASQIARIMEQQLQIKPVLSRTDEFVDGSRGGAAFDRILRIALPMAGLEAPNDLRDIMKAALELNQQEF